MENYTQPNFKSTTSDNNVQNEPLNKLDKQWQSNNITENDGVVGSTSIANENDTIDESYTLFVKNIRYNGVLNTPSKPIINVAGNINIDLSTSNLFNLNVTGDINITFTNIKDGHYTFLFDQDGGPFAVSFVTTIKYPGSVAFQLTNSVSASDILEVVVINTKLFAKGEYKNYG